MGGQNFRKIRIFIFSNKEWLAKMLKQF